MPKAPRVTAKKLLAALLRFGFSEIRQRGSHCVIGHVDGRMTVIPMHQGDIPPGTLASILRDIKISSEELGDIL